MVKENVEEDVLRATVAELKKRLEAGEISESLSVMTLNGI